MRIKNFKFNENCKETKGWKMAQMLERAAKCMSVGDRESAQWYLKEYEKLKKEEEKA